MKTLQHPVYPIPPSFYKDELEFTRTEKYIQFLLSNGAKRVMTTAGTSQFNLLSLKEVFALNTFIIDRFEYSKILGLPALSRKDLFTEIIELNKFKAKNTNLLIIFPERYYNDDQIIDYITAVCQVSDYPIYLHGNPLRKGNGGTYEYTSSLLRKLSKIPNFVGIKEEFSSIDLAFKTLSNISNLDVIVAGGSMRRFWSLAPYGATSFLTGVGSFNPIHSEYFFENYIEGDLERCLDMIEHIERPLFETFMNIGWHASMRKGLQNLGFLLEDRLPFVKLNDTDSQRVLNALNKVKSGK